MEIGTGIQKLLWVAAPLALALLALAVLAWRRRLPSRLGLNVGFSLLLLVYLLGTAGLGIFWVANQHLPVFDWHYLFGYATVVLLVVHLAFNLRTVWAYLRRKVAGQGPARSTGGTGATGRSGAAVGASAASAPPARRGVLGAAGLGGLATLGVGLGLGYLLGVRHGRTEFQVGMVEGGGSAAPPPARERTTSSPYAAGLATSGPGAAAAWAVVERFHTHSGHSRRGVLRHAASTDWGTAPPPFKAYPGAARVALPPPDARAPAAKASRAPDLAALSQWLWHTAGISESRGGIDFRTSPSSGALFATELYVLPLAVRGLLGAWWHYLPERHVLQRVPQAREGLDAPSALAGLQSRQALAQLPAGTQALVVASAIFARSGHKYGDRTYRYVLADLGHALENLRIATQHASGLEVQLLSHFDEAALAEALGLDGRREAVLAVAAMVTAADAATLAAPADAATTARRAALASVAPAHDARAPWQTATLPAWAGPEGQLGLTDAMQWATSLRPASPASAAAAPPPAAVGGTPARAAAGAASSTAAGAGTVGTLPALLKLPAADGRSSPTPSLSPATPRAYAAPLMLIAQRRSLRRFSKQPVSQQALAHILTAMAGPAPSLSPAVRIDVVTAALQDAPPASWRHDAAAGVLRPRTRFASAGELRQRARAAGLDQDVIGDAAVVFVLSLDRDTLRADAFGPARGYRHGFIEAGLVGERLYLAAGAVGLGVCAVGAFYDDEASALVGLDPAREWPVHFAALGMPA